MPILRHLLYAVFVLVLGQPYLIEAASRAPEILTGDHEFMNHTEPRSPSGGPSKKRKVAQDIEPEQRELMVGNKCHNAMIHPLKRENILVTGAEAGRYPKVWLGYDVMGQAEGLHQLTDVRELHHKEGSPYSFFRMMVDKEVEEGSEWTVEHVLDRMRKIRKRRRHLCKWKTEEEAKRRRSVFESVSLGTYSIALTMIDPADGFEISWLSATIRSQSLTPEFHMPRFRRMVSDAKIVRKESDKSPYTEDLEKQCQEQIQKFGKSASDLLGQRQPSSTAEGALAIFHWVTNHSLVYDYPENPSAWRQKVSGDVEVTRGWT
ncbi:hypothetical protein FOZ63_015260 [Perkinsus olseni]|uniref:Uncharacterized protein n=1 Tax=Perkinsus olseni TaxID=32597 RepID=A0A7J6NIJ5_PEROL|nr:hypothetical protein FOZ63_015260 [Perkinsus olseni]